MSPYSLYSIGHVVLIYMYMFNILNTATGDDSHLTVDIPMSTYSHRVTIARYNALPVWYIPGQSPRESGQYLDRAYIPHLESYLCPSQSGG